MVLDQALLTQLAWLVPFPPLIAFFLIWLFTNESRRISTAVALLGAGLTFVFAQLIFWGGVLHLNGVSYAEHPLQASAAWLSIGLDPAGWFKTGVLVDPLGAIMLFFVSITVLCIFVYSIGYHNFGQPRDPHDVPGLPPHAGGVEPNYSRFFAFISLFAAGMFTLVVSDNLLFLFVGWEIMGLCSYLLIGFWYGKPSAYRAAVKAFMTTRIGDVIMMLGIVYLYQVTGTLSFREIFTPERVRELAGATSLIAGISAAQLIFLLLFAGTVGKSAQWPLHVWLPDAMEGPTPVSAMIHAATMVSAGVYMVIRMFPLLGGTATGVAPLFVPMAAIGAFTALMASTMALSQSDIKRVLAFSTIAQLGYMIAALGLGAYVAAVFHLLTHAFFKALLFLGSGSVIHGMEHGHHHAEHAGHAAGHAGEHVAAHPAGASAHGEHVPHTEGPRVTDHAPLPGEAEPAHPAAPLPVAGDLRAEPFDPNNMFNMGGLLGRMPVTGWAFIIGGLALAGFPLITAGFWSKDEILTGALERGLGGGPDGAWGYIVLGLLSVSAFLTAFYTMRQIALTFLGTPRTDAARHAPENVWTITAPLVVLAVFAIAIGWIGIPENFPVLGQIAPAGNWLHHWLAEPIEHAEGGALFSLNLAGAEGAAVEGAAPYNPIPLAISLVVGLGGLAAGYLVYGRRPLQAGEADPLAGMPLWEFFKNRWYFDQLYDVLFIRPMVYLSEEIVPKVIDRQIIDRVLESFGPMWTWVADGYRTFDRVVVNGFGDGVADAGKWLGANFRPLQDGQVQHYILLAIAVTMGFIALFIGLFQ